MNWSVCLEPFHKNQNGLRLKSLIKVLTFFTSLWAISSISFRFSANFAAGTAKPLIVRSAGSCNKERHELVSYFCCVKIFLLFDNIYPISVARAVVKRNIGMVQLFAVVLHCVCFWRRKKCIMLIKIYWVNIFSIFANAPGSSVQP